MMKAMQKRYGLVGIATMLHFLVDGLCLCSVYLLTSNRTLPHLMALFIAYNLLAFLTQPITGYVADKMRNKHWMLIGSMTLLTIAVVLTVSTQLLSPVGEPMMFAVAVLLGIGNSLFHVWGGKQVVLQVGNDSRALGVFVSTGAFGLAVAVVFCSWILLYAFLLLLLILSAVYIYLSFGVGQMKVADDSPKKPDAMPLSGGGTVLALLLLAAFVMFRSYIGQEFGLGADKSDGMILLIGFITMTGKMAGGWVSRYLGIVRAFTVILIAVLVCIVTLHLSPIVIALAGLFAINLTMPITLYLANCVLPDREGLAFGILAAALMPGYIIK